MIELKSLACGFDGKVILQNINLNIKNHLSILGANGSGKSTLAKAICSLIEFDGEVFIDSTNTKELSLIDKAKTLSYIPAKLEIFDSFITVEEFVLLGRFPYKKNYFDYSEKDRKIASNTLEFLKISHLKENIVSSLSSGEQQLVLIAQALSQQSKIIIFDEPTANLDPHNSKIIAEHIKGLKEYHQIILITHDLHLASYVNNPVVFIKDKTTTLYENNFFNDDNLEELYDVKFNSLVAQYD
ncbi:MAG: ABC transporter ATP-binding protein [Sulfurimonas sp.]|nr:ABC transporter ATP-binding protein [Sulfurimonas sp.]